MTHSFQDGHLSAYEWPWKKDSQDAAADWAGACSLAADRRRPSGALNTMCVRSTQSVKASRRKRYMLPMSASNVDHSDPTLPIGTASWW
ncbi:hypothetical protein MASR1M101_27590 [Gemmatimonas sp.]